MINWQKWDFIGFVSSFYYFFSGGALSDTHQNPKTTMFYKIWTGKR